MSSQTYDSFQGTLEPSSRDTLRTVQIDEALMNGEHPGFLLLLMFNPHFLSSGVAAYHWKAVLLWIYSPIVDFRERPNLRDY